MSGKRTRRKSAGAVLYFPVAVLLILFLSAFGISAFLKIQTIEVTGNSLYGEEAIIGEAGISKGDNMLLVNAGAVSEKIRAAMPFISDVQITRILPDIININVSESSAAATISYQNDVLVIDSAGRVLQRVKAAPSGLIEIRGFTPSNPEEGKLLKTESGGETRLQYMTEVLKAMENADICGEVSYLDIANIANITFGYADRYTVILGGSNDIQHKLSQLTSRIITEIGNRDPEGTTGTINMSDPSGRWTWNADL